MNKVREWHDQAMQLVDEAFAARRAGDESIAKQKFQQAYALETQAALAVANELTNEPTRSVLLRSAATLALDCDEVREAERLVAMALAGNPPPDIADELRDLIVKAIQLQKASA